MQIEFASILRFDFHSIINLVESKMNAHIQSQYILIAKQVLIKYTFNL